MYQLTGGENSYGDRLIVALMGPDLRSWRRAALMDVKARSGIYLRLAGSYFADIGGK
jgi:hypothetical protein